MGLPASALQGYVRGLADYPADLGYTSTALQELELLGLDRSDVLFVWETSSISLSAKEDKSDIFFSVVGQTCDGELIEVRLAFDSDPSGLSVQHVARL